MVSARPQFEAACQLQSLLLWPTYKGTCLVSRSMLVGIQPAAPTFRWRDWPNGLGAGLWLQSREFDSLTVHQVWLGNSTVECWSEKPVDTVQFRAEPPFRGVA